MTAHRNAKPTLTAKWGQLPLLLIAGVGLIVVGLIGQLVILCVVGVLLLIAAAVTVYNRRHDRASLPAGPPTGLEQRAADRFGPPAEPAQVQPPQPVWDGTQWVLPQAAQTDQVTAMASLLAGVLVVIGTCMQFGSVSLLSGDSIYWIGAALAVVGTVVAFAKSHKPWLEVVALILAILCVVNVAYTEHQFSERRQQISDVFNN